MNIPWSSQVKQQNVISGHMLMVCTSATTALSPLIERIRSGGDNFLISIQGAISYLCILTETTCETTPGRSRSNAVSVARHSRGLSCSLNTRNPM